MSRVVQARLDDQTESDLNRLRELLGGADSDVVPEAIQRMASSLPAPKKRKFRGVGKYNSGLPDLAANPKHLDDFGK